MRPIVTGITLAVLLLVPLGVLSAEVWTSRADAVSDTDRGRAGVAYLGPYTELVAALGQAQTQAVQGKAADSPALQQAIGKLDEADARYGGTLRTTAQWTNVKSRIQSTIHKTYGGRATAFREYAVSLDLLIQLGRKAGDESRLLRYPEIDGARIANALVVGMPSVIMNSGRALDATYLLVRPDPAGSAEIKIPGVSAADTAAAVALYRSGQAAAAAYQTGIDADGVFNDLDTAFANTDSRTLASALVAPTDAFRTSADIVSPAQVLIIVPPNAIDLTQRSAVRAALVRDTLTLSRVAREQMVPLLDARADDARQARWIAAGLLGFGVLLVLGLIVVLLRARRPAVERSGATTRRAGRHAGPDADGQQRDRTLVGAAAGDFGAGPPDPPSTGSRGNARALR